MTLTHCNYPSISHLCVLAHCLIFRSSYSLSGHVSIALTSPYAIYGPRRTARILLHSVTLTFEGQSEVLMPLTGYSAVRLCTETHEITPPEPVEMNNEGHEDSGKPCRSYTLLIHCSLNPSFRLLACSFQYVHTWMASSISSLRGRGCRGPIYIVCRSQVYCGLRQ